MADVIDLDDFRGRERRLEVLCQGWYDSDQSAGFTLHGDFKSWKAYKDKRIEETRRNPYPFQPIGDPILVLVSESTYGKIKKTGTLVFGYNYGNNMDKMIREGHILEKVG